MIAELEFQLIATIQALFDQAGWFGIAAWIAFESATGLSPSELILGLAGWMLLAAHEEPAGMIFVAGLFVSFGSAVGTSFTYGVVRLGGRPLVDRVIRKLKINPRYLENVESQFNRWGPGLVFFGRLLPGIRILVAVPAGLTRMNYLKFFSYSWAGSYIWCTFCIGMGYAIGHEWTSIARTAGQLLPAFFAGLLVLAAGIWIAHRIFLRRISSQVVWASNESKKQ